MAAMYFCKPEDLDKHKDQFEDDHDDDVLDPEVSSSTGPIPPLNILIMIVGSRGDVQPFIAFGKGTCNAQDRINNQLRQVCKRLAIVCGCPLT
jgi:hypothetical protein